MFESAPIRLRPKSLNWTTVTIGKGETLKGWLAGPLVTVECHWLNGASRACRAAITKGVLKCYCEEEFNQVRTIGYVPLLTKEGDKFVILLSKTVAVKVRDYAYGVPVKFSRPKRDKAPLNVAAIDAHELGISGTKAMQQRKPADIRPYLIYLWQDDVLTEHFSKVPTDSVPLCERPILTVEDEFEVDTRTAARENIGAQAARLKAKKDNTRT